LCLSLLKITKNVISQQYHKLIQERFKTQFTKTIKDVEALVNPKGISKPKRHNARSVWKELL